MPGRRQPFPENQPQTQQEKETMKRRGRNEGSVYQRGDGTWTASLSLGRGANGKRKRRGLYARTKVELLESHRRAQHANDRGQLPESNHIPVADFADLWLQDVKSATAKRTHEYYEHQVE